MLHLGQDGSTGLQPVLEADTKEPLDLSGSLLGFVEGFASGSTRALPPENCKFLRLVARERPQPKVWPEPRWAQMSPDETRAGSRGIENVSVSSDTCDTPCWGSSSGSSHNRDPNRRQSKLMPRMGGAVEAVVKVRSLDLYIRPCAAPTTPNGSFTRCPISQSM